MKTFYEYIAILETVHQPGQKVKVTENSPHSRGQEGEIVRVLKNPTQTASDPLFLVRLASGQEEQLYGSNLQAFGMPPVSSRLQRQLARSDQGAKLLDIAGRGYHAGQAG